MKKVFTFIFILLSIEVFSQNIIQQGIVTEQNSGKKNLAGVSIKVVGAVPVASDTKGSFQLVFENQKVGDRIKVSDISLTGYEVVNRKEVYENGLISSNPFKIVLCKEGLFAQNTAKYYDIFSKALAQSFDKQKKENQEKYDKKLIVEQNFSNQVYTVELRFQIWRERLHEMADKFARYNYDDASLIQQQAFDAFKRGDIDEAIRILETVSTEKEIDKLKTDSLQQTIEKLMYQAQLYEVVDRCTDAEKMYKIAVLADTTNYENVSCFASHLQNQLLYEKAIYWYKIALNSVKNDESKKASICYHLGNTYWANNFDFENAIKILSRALEIQERLVKDYPQTYEPNLAQTCEKLGNAYYSKKDLVNGEKMLLRALEIKERLVKDNPKTYEPEIARLYCNLGFLYCEKNDLGSGEKMLLSALEIRERLAKGNPQIYEPDMAETCFNLGSLYFNKNDFVNTEKMLLRALEIRERLAKGNPQIYEPDIAKTCFNLGNLYNYRSDFANAEKMYLRVLEIRERLAKDYPQTNESYIEQISNTLGNFYYSQNDFNNAETMYLKALQSSEYLAKDSPIIYGSLVVKNSNFLGNFYYSRKDLSNAETMYLKALQSYKRLKNYSQINELDYCLTMGSICVIYREQYKFSRDKKYKEQALNYLNIMEEILKKYGEDPKAKKCIEFNNLLKKYFDRN